MTNTSEHVGRWGGRLSTAAWIAAGLLWLLPLIAMQFTAEVDWTVSDFVLWAVMLVVVAGAFDLANRLSSSMPYRLAAGLALGGAFLLVWVNLAVGVIGDEDNPANLMFAGVLAVGLIGSVLARFRPDGMMRAMLVTAAAQAMVAVIAVVAGYSLAALLTGFFAVLWLLSAALFRWAAHDEATASPVS